MSAERPHHPFSPSQLSSLQACPSYEGAKQDVPHFRTVIGSKGHAVIETREDDATLSDEDAAYAAQAIELYESEKEKLGDGVTELAEVYVSVDDYDTTAGYFDAALIKGPKCVLLDWKLGMWPVPPAKENLQLQAYVQGLFRAYPQLEEIRVIIFQPTCDFKSEWTYTRADVPELYKKTWAIVARAKAARAAGLDFETTIPYYPNCNFCKHVGRCPSVSALAGSVGKKFAPLLVPANIRPEQILDPKDARVGWQLAAVVEAWAKAFRSEITDRVLRKETPAPEGYKLTSRSGRRKIVNLAKYREIALRLLTEEEYAATLKPSLTAAENKILEKTPRGQKEKTVEAFAEELAESGATMPGEASVFLKAVPQKPKAEEASKAWAAEQNAAAGDLRE